MKSDIEIAQSVALEEIDAIAKKIDIPLERLEHYGKYKAKVNVDPAEIAKNPGKLSGKSKKSHSKF